MAEYREKKRIVFNASTRPCPRVDAVTSLVQNLGLGTIGPHKRSTGGGVARTVEDEYRLYTNSELENEATNPLQYWAVC
jgi:hypothetical protein